MIQGSSGQSPPRLFPPALHLPHSCLQGGGDGACRMDPPGASPAGAANLGSGCQKPWGSFGSALFQWEVVGMGRAQGEFLPWVKNHQGSGSGLNEDQGV